MLLLEDRDDVVVAVEPTWRDRLSARIHAGRLDQDLAEQAAPLALLYREALNDLVARNLPHRELR